MDAKEHEGMNPDELLALWKADMEDGEKREMIKVLGIVKAGLEQSLVESTAPPRAAPKVVKLPRMKRHWRN